MPAAVGVQPRPRARAPRSAQRAALGRLAALLACLAPLATTATACSGRGAAAADAGGPLAGWVDYAAADGSYRVRFPSAPTVVEEDVDTAAGPRRGRVATVFDRAAGRAYFATSFDMQIAPATPLDVAAALERGSEQMLAGLGARLLASRELAQGQIPGRELRYEKPGEPAAPGAAPGAPMSGLARLYCDPASRTLYQVNALYSGALPDAEAHAFVETFTITPRPAAPPPSPPATTPAAAPR